MALDTKYTNWQVAGLVALRVLIGWHFLYEGIAKLMKPGWTAAGYLLQSKWLFSGLFHAMAANEAVMDAVNFLNIWGLIFIGLGLIVGAFTRAASLAGMALILLYYVCNPPLVGLYYTIPSEGNYLIVNKNIVELAALFVLFLFPTGKILGMDRLISRLLNRIRS
ncbi:DoxX family membrane protein [bacterium]|nr:DoxX family membrane protein [bacterium]